MLSVPLFEEEPVVEPSNITKLAAIHQEVEVTNATDSIFKLSKESKQSEDEVVAPHNLYVFSNPHQLTKWHARSVVQNVEVLPWT